MPRKSVAYVMAEREAKAAKKTLAAPPRKKRKVVFSDDTSPVGKEVLPKEAGGSMIISKDPPPTINLSDVATKEAEKSESRVDPLPPCLSKGCVCPSEIKPEDLY